MSIIRLICCSLATVLFLSCDKGRVDSGPSLIPATWGKLSAVKQKIIKISGTDTVVTTAEIAQANFYADPQKSAALTTAGNLIFNGRDVQPNSSYVYYRQENSLDLNTRIEWQAEGNAFFQKFSYKDTTVFPQYTGPIPSSVSKSSGLNMVFDSTSVFNADSVRVQIDDTYNHILVWTFSARAGAVNIPAAALQQLTTVTDQTAVIAIMPYAGTNKVFLDKTYYFARETRTFQSTNIN